ncbi:hypothetical protein Vadar_028877 [Vaccinium darrowii]|uniref:Uncharacterized protein n=1 Tax=Vaccinium darrowii TaxID=229202 RepID=A0ACB7Y9D1_9ERIC|nr:hypothetical protein Vadar_028877 [Vaccinium darrowii]
MFAAVVSLFFVILFITFLHIYAKLFLTQSPHPHRIIRIEVFSSASLIFGPTYFRQFFDVTVNCPVTAKGLDSLVIAKIPLFVVGFPLELSEVSVASAGGT